MAAKRPKKITIELRPIRTKIAKAVGQAKRSIDRGEKAIRKAAKEGRREDAQTNRKRQRKAKNAKAKLDRAFKLMRLACCNQLYNCDPDYL